MEQGSKEMKLQGRYPEYTVYSHPIQQRALAIATLLLFWHGCIHRHMTWTRCIIGNPSEAG